MEEKQVNKSVMLRIPEDLKDWVKKKAAKAERSANWTIVKIIEQAKREEEARQ